MLTKHKIAAATLVLMAGAAGLTACNGDNNAVAATKTRTIIMVWDGLRPDSINPTDTPNLYALQQKGVNFADNHSTYPTFTMMNGSSFATGSFPKTSGFYGNTFWTPPDATNTNGTIPAGKTASGGTQDYQDPVFTEDYQVLDTLNSYYGNQLLLVKTLFKTAQDAGLTTAAVGKSGAAYIQDLGRGGYFIDENTVAPRSLATELQAANIALPKNVVNDQHYTADPVTLATGNGDPTARAGYITFPITNYDPNGVLTVAARDSTDSTQGAPEDASNKYLLNVYTSYILPKKKPDLSVIWFRTPDNEEHGYGPGSANYHKGLQSQDARLGELMTALKANNMDSTTNIVVVSDHGHSSVSGPTSLFPLLTINASTSVTNGTSNATIGGKDPINGFSFSGDVRSADLLTYAGFQAFDGNGCSTSAMYGLKNDGTPVLPVNADNGTLCGSAKNYQAISATATTPTASFKVPATLPANGIVVATNGGSDYFYVPSHDTTTVTNLVKFLQSREQYGAVFVDSRYGNIPGTLMMKDVNLENTTRQDHGQPDVIVSFTWDSQQVIQGMPGIEYESTGGQRGMHGSFSPIDVHNTLLAMGPGFKSGVTVSNPTGNVDVAPTVAQLFGLSMPQADGRVINEALAKPVSSSTPSVASSIMNPATPATGLTFKVPTDLTGATNDTTMTGGQYSINLKVKDLTVDGKTYRYFDYAQAVRN